MGILSAIWSGARKIATHKIIDEGLKSASDAVSGGIKKKFAEHRSELLAFIQLKLADDHSRILVERIRRRLACEPRTYDAARPYVPGDENHAVTLLTKLKQHLAAPDELEDCINIFTTLAEMTDREFDTALEFLDHDVFVQWMKRNWTRIKKVNSWLNCHEGAIRNADQRLQAWARRWRML